MKKHDQPGQQSKPNGEYPTDNQPPREQLIPEKGEEYLREVANIEDMPSPEEDQEAGNTLEEEQRDNELRK